MRCRDEKKYSFKIFYTKIIRNVGLCLKKTAIGGLSFLFRYSSLSWRALTRITTSLAIKVRVSMMKAPQETSLK